MKAIVKAYLITALWATIGVSDEFLADNHSLDDVSPCAEKRAAKDCKKFEKKAKKFLRGLTPDQIGHDLFLTRNNYGVGFWDRGLGEVGDILARLATDMGEVSFYVGDDNKIYSE